MNNNSLILKTLVISFLLHFGIFHLFQFSFPVKPPGHKPKIIFLGSILKHSKTTNKSFYKNKRQNIFNSNQFTDKKYTFKDNPFSINDKRKPKGAKVNPEESKTVEKSLFKIDYKKKSKQKGAGESIDEKYQNSPYVPIQLKKTSDIF